MALKLSVEKVPNSMESSAKRLSMFRELVRIRMVEEAISTYYTEQQMRCPVHLCIGQEAVAVGVCANLSNDDYVFSTHRAHSHYLAKGGNLNAFIAELYGKASGCCGGRGGSMHLVDIEAGFLGCVPIVASSIPIAVGTAFEIKRRNLNSISVAFFGEASTEEGVFYESLNFAHFHALPILFVCENNLYSVETPYECRRHNSINIGDIVKGFKIETSLCDGQDLDLIYSEAKKAIDKIRKGGGPHFIEFETQRLVEHCGPKIHMSNDDAITSIDMQRDPVKIFKEKVIQEGMFSEKEIEEIQHVFSQEIDNAFKMAKLAPYPSKEDLSKHIYFEEKND
jgi:pyruvate dehydrogenase E1 component alpha subunit